MSGLTDKQVQEINSTINTLQQNLELNNNFFNEKVKPIIHILNKHSKNQDSTLIQSQTAGAGAKSNIPDIERLQQRKSELEREPISEASRKEIKHIGDKIKLLTKQMLSTRPEKVGIESFKINELEYLINSAIDDLKNKIPVKLPSKDDFSLDITVTNFKELRQYILNHTNDPITILLRLPTLERIYLDDFLPKILDDTFKVRRNSEGILKVINNTSNESVDMPDPLGNPYNRKAFSAKYKENKCYGLGGDKSSDFCVSLLNKCLASDDVSLNECKVLFNEPDWKDLIEDGIKNTNVFLIKEFLIKIGYPRINNNFDTNFDSWIDIIEKRYNLEDKALSDIKQNDKLKIAISGMVSKYNKIINAERPTKTGDRMSLRFHIPMKKGGDYQSILNTNLYELNGGGKENILNLPAISPSQKIYNIFKELVKDQNITNTYKNFFDKMKRNIENNNHDIDDQVVQQFNTLLKSFRESEEKLNKLLQTMHNFAWFLGSNVDTSDLTDDEKKFNQEASDKLKSVLNEENIQAYNAAREKLVNSLNRKSRKMLSIAANYPFILIAS